MAAGLALAALAQRDGAGPGLVAVWAIALGISGVGIGAAWPHLSVWAMGSDDGGSDDGGSGDGAADDRGSIDRGSVDDTGEQAIASAAINTVQLMCAAFGAGLAGVLVNLRETPDASAARWVFGVFAGIAALGWFASSRAGRRV